MRTRPLPWFGSVAELARRVRHMEEPAKAFADFIRNNCEIIRVETDDADEAFRVFDSQNYRGSPCFHTIY